MEQRLLGSMTSDVTTIQLLRTTYDDLADVGRKGETFDDIVRFLIDSYHHICRKYTYIRPILEYEMKQKKD